MKIKKNLWVLPLFVLFLFYGCSIIQDTKINLTDAKIANGIDEKLMPVGIADIFPEGTAKVFCWFQWLDAGKNTKITAKWHFVTDNIHVLDYAFAIPRKEGSGSVSLAMPEGKTLPAGLYRVDLMAGTRLLKSLTFKIS